MIAYTTEMKVSQLPPVSPLDPILPKLKALTWLGLPIKFRWEGRRLIVKSSHWRKLAAVLMMMLPGLSCVAILAFMNAGVIDHFFMRDVRKSMIYITWSQFPSILRTGRVHSDGLSWGAPVQLLSSGWILRCLPRMP